MKIADELTLSGSNVKSNLGHPFGTIITIEGERAKNEEQSKADADKVILVIKMVNQQKLAKSLRMPLEYFSWSDFSVPEPGESFSIIGYETGRFSGIPRKAFQYIPIATTTEFFFESYFVGLKRK